VLGRDSAGEPVWNRLFLDFALRVGFTIQLCAPYRAQTKGRVESGAKYVGGNFWPTVEFTDETDLNSQARTWLEEDRTLKRGMRRDHGLSTCRPPL